MPKSKVSEKYAIIKSWLGIKISFSDMTLIIICAKEAFSYIKYKPKECNMNELACYSKNGSEREYIENSSE